MAPQMALAGPMDNGSLELCRADSLTASHSYGTVGDGTMAKDTAGMSVDFTGTSGALSGVAAGKLADGSNEAVNSAQLFATNQTFRPTRPTSPPSTVA
jgi:hypothetical protein